MKNLKEVNIRVAKKSEVKRIHNILAESFIEFKGLYTKGAYDLTVATANEIQNRIKEGQVWVAEIENVIVGTVGGLPKNKEFHIRGMVVLPMMRGKKIGYQLLQYAEGYARKNDFTLLTLCSSAYLDRALSLYKRFGFRIVNEPPYQMFGTPCVNMEKEIYDTKKVNKIKIIDYEQQYSSDFKAISVDWFESDFFKRNFTVEEIDLQVISNPFKYILKNGGHIFFAKLDNRIVGTVALIPSELHSFELSKLGVLEEYRGLKISDMLIQAAINYSSAQDKKTLWLESIRILKPALALFRKYGFIEIPLSPNSHYDRADIKMELQL